MTPFYKSNDKNRFTKYRSIPVLNFFSINLKKTNYIIFKLPKNDFQNITKLKLHETKIKRVEDAKVLGEILNQHHTRKA